MGDEKRKKYNSSNPRFPDFYKRFHGLTDYAGGVTKVSELTGISRPTVQFWYNGERTPDAENLCTLSRAFGVSVDYLLGLADEDNATNDEKLRMVSEYTGLSNAAIRTVVNLKRFFRTSIDSLNALLADDSLLLEITRYLSLAVSSMCVYKKDGSDAADSNFIENMTFVQGAISKAGDGYIMVGDKPLNIPKGTLLLSAKRASDFYKSEATNEFAQFVDAYVHTESEIHSRREEE